MSNTTIIRGLAERIEREAPAVPEVEFRVAVANLITSIDDHLPDEAFAMIPTADWNRVTAHLAAPQQAPQAAPIARPLSDEQIKHLEVWPLMTITEVVRVIERAHGIKGD